MADQSNPWDTTPAADSAANSADAWGSSTPADGGGADWLHSAPAPQAEPIGYMSPQQLDKRERAYTQVWSRIIKDSGFQPQ